MTTDHTPPPSPVQPPSADGHRVHPLRTLPGRPVASGFTLLSPAEQERHRQSVREINERLLPWIEEANLCRARAAAAARTAFIR